MKKIPTIFKRDENNRGLVTPDANPEAAWVFGGEGVATRKYDGTCCMVRGGKLFKRYELRRGATTPAGFEAATEFDENTGKQQGWLPVDDGPADKWHREALRLAGAPFDGTYELVGPKVQGNPERFTNHCLISHQRGVERFSYVPRNYDGLREWLRGNDIEGIVFHHPDGRMAKIKLKDFGYVRGRAE